MDAAPSLETVLQALHALYHGDNSEGKEKASLWLGELQKSVFAWQISDQLLQLNQDVESCYFAAQTMRTKIQYAFHELPPTSHLSLKNSLLCHCEKINQDSPHVIVTQLCLALSDLALQMVTWNNAANELIQQFGGLAERWTFLLEVLSLLPEEINSRSLRLGANRRNDIIMELTNASELLIQFLSVVMESRKDDERVCCQVLHCLGSWLSICAIPHIHLTSANLLQLPFSVLVTKDCSSQLHKAASECICSALMSVEDLEKTSTLAKVIFDGVLSLSDSYHLSVTAVDLDKSINYSRIFTETGETFMEAIINSPNQGFGDFRTLQLLLACVDHPNFEVADVTFTFWNRLNETLYDMNKPYVNELFKPFIARLVNILCRHCRYDASADGILDGPDDFEDFRLRSTELISDVTFIVGANDIFSDMFEILKNSGSSWEVAESAILVMTAVAKHMSTSDQQIIPLVLEIVLRLPPTIHQSIRFSSMKLVGELKDWIDRQPQCIEPVLQFLLVGLQQPKLSTMAAESIESICSCSPDQMTNLFGQLLQIVQAVDSFNISNDAVIGLLKGSAHILGRMSHDMISDGLRQLCAGQVENLCRIIDNSNESGFVDSDGVVKHCIIGNKQSDPTVWLDRLAAIFRYTTPTVQNGQIHPCQDVILQVWSVISKVFQKYSYDVRIIERCCRCIRFAVRCLGNHSNALLNPLTTQIVQLYRLFPHSCCLYLGSILVDEYGTDSGCSQMLQDMLQEFSVPTMNILGENNGLRNHPDIVDDLFRLCYRFMLRTPITFLQCNTVKMLLKCAIAGCCLDHKDANESVTKFLVEFIKTARQQENGCDSTPYQVLSSQLVQEDGQDIVNSVLKAALFCLPSFMIPDSAEILYALLLCDRQSVCRWLETTLKALPNQTASGTVTATNKQLADFHKAVTSAEELKQVTRAMRDFARLYR